MTPCVPTLLYRNQFVLCCKVLEFLILYVATLDRTRDCSSVETEKDLFNAKSEDDLIINDHTYWGEIHCELLGHDTSRKKRKSMGVST
jgi:hypothetical protein